MKTFEDIEKEFDELAYIRFRYQQITYAGDEIGVIKSFIKEISDQIIDDMIGKEVTKALFDGDGRCRECYNLKVQELKEYKLKFNK